MNNYELFPGQLVQLILLLCVRLVNVMCKTCPGFYIFGKLSLDSKKIRTFQTKQKRLLRSDISDLLNGMTINLV